VGFKKPAVEIFQKAIEWANVSPPKIFIDLQGTCRCRHLFRIQSIQFISMNN
jgi:hypothetical protein